jgi:hypothetical protein
MYCQCFRPISPGSRAGDALVLIAADGPEHIVQMWCRGHSCIAAPKDNVSPLPHTNNHGTLSAKTSNG